MLDVLFLLTVVSSAWIIRDRLANNARRKRDVVNAAIVMECDAHIQRQARKRAGGASWKLSN